MRPFILSPEMKFDMNSINNDNERRNNIRTNIWPAQMPRSFYRLTNIRWGHLEEQSNQMDYDTHQGHNNNPVCKSHLFFSFVFLSPSLQNIIGSLLYGICFSISLFVLDFQHSVKWKWIASERNKNWTGDQWQNRQKGKENNQLTIAFRVSVCFDLNWDSKRYIKKQSLFLSFSQAFIRSVCKE